jgi:hypothetical protein
MDVSFLSRYRHKRGTALYALLLLVCVRGFLEIAEKSDERSWYVSRLRRFDVYPKTIQDYQVRTLGGALVSICG